MLRLTTSADKRFAAISKVVRVRVLGSKNKLNMDLPRSKGTFLTSRSVTPTKDSAVSRIFSRIAADNPSVVSRCCNSPFLFSCGLFTGYSLSRRLSYRLRLNFPLSAFSSASILSEGKSSVAPIYWATMGSSLPPRSTKAARRTLAGLP
jgi:hypothetical protein